jgi:hypothetical protein
VYRDADWYARTEQVYKNRIEETELFCKVGAGETLNPGETQRAEQLGLDRGLMERIRLLPTSTDLAAAVVNLAVLQHEQGKYSEAEEGYRRARGLYECTSIAEALRQVMLPWIDAQTARCRQGEPPDEPDEPPALRLENPALTPDRRGVGEKQDGTGFN